MKQRFLALERKVGSVVSLLAATLLVLAVAAGAWQVLSRFVLQSPSVWTEVLTRTLLVWCVFLGVSLAFRRGTVISVDLLLRSTRGVGHQRVRLFIVAVQVAFLGLLTFVGAQMAWMVRFQTMVALDLPMSWAYAAIPTGALLSILASVAYYLDPGAGELAGGD